MEYSNVSSSTKNLDTGTKCRGHVDGFSLDGKLRGWAFLAADPYAGVNLDLRIYDITVATVTTTLIRADLDRILGLPQPGKIGFEFNMSTFGAEGALSLLRRLEADGAPIDFMKSVKICIAGTNEALPMGAKNIGVSLDPQTLRPALVNAAVKLIREEIKTNPGRPISNFEQEIILRSSHLFVPEWYCETYGDVVPLEIDPAQHYLRIGGELARAPGPWFDSASYLEATPEARNSGLSPLVHYELNGSATWWPGKGRFRGPSTGDGQKDYALIIHMYHLDTAPDLQRLITHFPKGTDVFVSIPADSDNHDPKQIAAMFPNAEILEVPNLGQDVGAFLAVTRLLQGRGYRFFCKVHSKKGNKFPDLWRRQMLDAVAATPERVEKIIGLFREDERLLLLGPASYWLDNHDFDLNCAAQLDELMAKSGFGAVAKRIDWGFFAGTCFWIDAELATQIAKMMPAEAFFETTVSNHGQTAHVGERLFGLLPIAVAGRVAIVDSYEWTPPSDVGALLPDRVRLPEGMPVGDFLSRHILSQWAPRNIGSSQLDPALPQGVDLFPHADSALHGDIDVIISCWMGYAEPMHEGLARLHNALSMQGLTSALILGGRPPVAAIESFCNGTILLEPISMNLLLNLPPEAQATPCKPLPEEFVELLLHSEYLFRGLPLPAGAEREAAVTRIQNVHAIWRENLIRHRVKMFLIWGNTAPKSRLFIYLCKDLGIEYQIIERGHFPGTISYDPIGQFGFGVRPMMLEHGSTFLPPAAISDRFDEIFSWYEQQKESTAYPDFHQNETKDIQVMRRAKRYGRPIILVIGGNDQGAGITGPESASDPLRLNWFQTSDQAFARIRHIVASKFPDALLVLRPHPSQKQEDSEFVLVARKTSLDELIEHADICITIVTSASALCLLKNKPVLSLGLSELNGTDGGDSISDETELLAMLRRHIWAKSTEPPYPNDAHKRHIVDLFDRHLIGMDDSVPTRHGMNSFSAFLADRIRRKKSSFLQTYTGQENRISQALYDDIRARGRAEFRIDPMAFSAQPRPTISVVLPIYGDYEGTQICFEQLRRHQDENGYRVIAVWDCGPDPRLRDLCRDYAEKAGFTYLENAENVGFSGTVNAGMLAAGTDDVILLNSDTVPCGDWALRLQDAAYAHPKIGTVSPFSNNASICNLPFPKGQEMPIENPVTWTEEIDSRARKAQPFTVEMPVAHGFCVYIRRSLINRIGMFSEIKFDRGYGEDNEFSMRARMAGYICGIATNVMVGHAGSTSFSEDGDSLRLNGREVLHKEFPLYMNEISEFYRSDPLTRHRRVVLGEDRKSA